MRLYTPLPTTPTSARPPLVQRRCACGGTPGPTGECAACRGRRLAGAAFREPDERFEREAERIATTASEGAPGSPPAITPLVQRQPEEDEEEEETLQRSAEGPTTNSPTLVPSGGQPLATTVRVGAETRLGHDFSRVRVHTGPRAAASARSIGAAAYTVGRDIVFGEGRFAPESPAGLRLLTHELVHVVQQRGHAALQRRPDDRGGLANPSWIGPSDEQLRAVEQCMRNTGRRSLADCTDQVLGYRVPDTNLASQSEAARGALEIHEFTIDASWSAAIEEFFAKEPRRAPALPAGRKIVISSSVEARFYDGLRRVGAFFLDQDASRESTTPSVLPPNATFNVAIQATGQIFRFSRLGAERLLIEQLGPIPAAPSAATPAEPQPEGKFKVGDIEFDLGPGWSQLEFAGLKRGLEALPARARAQVAGLHFKREAAPSCTPAQVTAGSCNPNWAGVHFYNHQQRRHEITLFDRAFSGNARREGRHTTLTSTVVHEVGHAIDQQPLLDEMRRFNRQPTKESRRRLLGARSRSGRRYVEGGAAAGGKRTYNIDENAASSQGAFREAAIADGLVVSATGALSGGITDYSEEKWSEAFAEAFSIYITDPDLLRLLRPHLFAYFEKEFPTP